MRNTSALKSKDTAAKGKEAIQVAGETFSIGDDVLVQGDGAELPFVGKIKSFHNNRKDLKGTRVKVNWFYRPEEVRDGRKEFHGDQEVFKSDHTDLIDPRTFIGKCQVHTLNKYRDLDEESDTDFFTRFTYDSAKKTFGPDTVPVYCVCELPYNPDSYMIMCEQCHEWYHPRCIGLSAKEVKLYNDSPFICSVCVGGDKS